MAAIYFRGDAIAVAQIDTVQITAYDAATTYKLTVGGVTVSAVGNTDANTTATDLNTAWNASTHPYFSTITATVSTDTITLTADTAGVPFTATSSVTDGTGTIGSVTSSTAFISPHDAANGDNYSGGAAPATGDDLTISDHAVNICWGLGQSGVTLASLTIPASYTGKIGLKWDDFATSADGATVATTRAHEYRDHYLNIGWTVANLGAYIGDTAASGSGRLKLQNAKSGSSTTTVHSAATASESGLPSVRLLASNAGADIFTRTTLGGVGIAAEASDTATVGIVAVTPTDATATVDSSSWMFVGPGTTLTEFEQNDGTNILWAAADIPDIRASGGTLITEGDYEISSLVVDGGIVFSNNIKTSGNAIATGYIESGTLAGIQSNQKRTWDKISVASGATLKADPKIVKINSQFDDTTTQRNPQPGGRTS